MSPPTYAHTHSVSLCHSSRSNYCHSSHTCSSVSQWILPPPSMPVFDSQIHVCNKSHTCACSVIVARRQNFPNGLQEDHGRKLHGYQGHVVHKQCHDRWGRLGHTRSEMDGRGACRKSSIEKTLRDVRDIRYKWAVWPEHLGGLCFFRLNVYTYCDRFTFAL